MFEIIMLISLLAAALTPLLPKAPDSDDEGPALNHRSQPVAGHKRQHGTPHQRHISLLAGSVGCCSDRAA